MKPTPSLFVVLALLGGAACWISVHPNPPGHEIAPGPRLSAASIKSFDSLRALPDTANGRENLGKPSAVSRGEQDRAELLRRFEADYERALRADLIPLALFQVERLRPQLVDSLRAGGAPELEAEELLRLAVDERLDIERRAAALILTGLAGSSDHSTDPLLVKLATGVTGERDNNIRAAAAHALALRSSPEALAEVIRYGAREANGNPGSLALNAADRRTAEIGLAHLGPTPGVVEAAALGELLSPERHAFALSEAAFRAAARTEDPALWGEVIDQAAAGRSAAIEALTELSAPGLARELAPLLDCPATTAQERKRARLAATALLRTGDSLSIDALRDGIGMSTWRRAASLDALRRSPAHPDLWGDIARLAGELGEDDPATWNLVRCLRRSLQTHDAPTGRAAILQQVRLLPPHSSLASALSELGLEH